MYLVKSLSTITAVQIDQNGYANLNLQIVTNLTTQLIDQDREGGHFITMPK